VTFIHAVLHATAACCAAQLDSTDHDRSKKGCAEHDDGG
jgi:hypothetical protein